MRANGTSATSPQLLDVCHVGVVLRVVLGVEGLLALGLMLITPDLQSWMAALSMGMLISLPAVLAWLLLVCGLKALLARQRPGVQALLLCGLGAVCSLLSAELLSLTSFESLSRWRLAGMALVGACAAGAVFAWLRQRARLQLPSDAMARLAELQSRIRPHFLFNTLNSAIALVRADPQRAETLLEDLCELFRVALEDDGAAVTLAQEVELARRYLEIEQVRFGERLRLNWQLDPAANAARVPPLLLQPLVENAVRHGVEPNAEGGEVEISTQVHGSEVEIRVSNSVAAPTRIPGHGLALDNVRQRLLLMHDVAARFELPAVPGRFTVRIHLPK